MKCPVSWIISNIELIYSSCQNTLKCWAHYSLMEKESYIAISVIFLSSYVGKRNLITSVSKILLPNKILELNET
jgi:hypothetical protein